MSKVNIYEAKTRLSQLIEQVENGEEVVIARAGKPVAKLVPWKEVAPNRKPGAMRGRIRIGRDFDDPLPPDLFDFDEP